MSRLVITDQPETARGRALYQMLLSIHALIRRDLDAVQALAAQALDGVDGDELRWELEELRRGSVLWRLQVSCLRHCRFVHMHHHAEDVEMFTALRAANPAIGPVVDRLEADHRRVSDDLDAVEAAANALGRDEGSRAAVVEALETLRANLLEHLEYEELNVESTLRRMP
jgi:hypothetical protein